MSDKVEITEGQLNILYARIEQLEAALRLIASESSRHLHPQHYQSLAREALDHGIAIANQSSPPKGSWNDAIEAAAKRAEAEPHDENEHDAITISRCIALGIRALKQS